MLLDYGADPNYPFPNASPLCATGVTKETYLLLLERGADPMKLVKGRPAFWKVLSRGPGTFHFISILIKNLALD
jgi:hypothetical protein